jgi:hypothetical protein
MSRYNELGKANWVYWIGVGGTLIMIYFDRQIHEYFDMAGWKKARRTSIENSIADAKANIHNWQDAANAGQDHDAETVRLGAASTRSKYVGRPKSRRARRA